MLETTGQNAPFYSGERNVFWNLPCSKKVSSPALSYIFKRQCLLVHCPLSGGGTNAIEHVSRHTYRHIKSGGKPIIETLDYDPPRHMHLEEGGLLACESMKWNAVGENQLCHMANTCKVAVAIQESSNFPFDVAGGRGGDSILLYSKLKPMDQNGAPLRPSSVLLHTYTSVFSVCVIL